VRQRGPRHWHLPGAHASPLRLLLLLAVLAGATWLSNSAFAHAQLLAAIDYTSGLMTEHPLRGALMFLLLSAMSAMLMFFSSVLLVPLGIEAWGAPGCFLLLWAGWALGGLVTYSVGRGLGRPVVEKLLSAEKIARYEARVPAGASFGTALLVQLAFPSDVVGYFFGLLRYRFRTYLLALLCAEFPYAFGTVFLGAAFMERQYPMLAGGAAAVAALLVWQWWMRRRARGA
jgi:uncharacterized membrane protein YdjX (TVP38/TMEM64 family)